MPKRGYFLCLGRDFDLVTGHIGDGKIFVYNVDKVVKVRTGEEDYAALQDVE